MIESKLVFQLGDTNIKVGRIGGKTISSHILWISAIFPDISSRPDLRAYHASEIPIIFGTYNSSTFAPPTANEIIFSKYVQGAWVAFARDPQKGLVNYGWPLYNPTTVSVAQLGNVFNQTGVLFGLGTLLDLGCPLADVLIDAVVVVVELLNVLL